MTHEPLRYERLTPAQLADRARARLSSEAWAERRRQAARRWLVNLLGEMLDQLVLAAVVMVALQMAHAEDARIPALGFWTCVFLLIVARIVFGWRGDRS